MPSIAEKFIKKIHEKKHDSTLYNQLAEVRDFIETQENMEEAAAFINQVLKFILKTGKWPNLK